MGILGKGRVPWQRASNFLKRIPGPRKEGIKGAPRTPFSPLPPKSVLRKLRSEREAGSTLHPMELFTCPVHSPTTRSAMKVSSVSPERWDTMTPHPFDWASLHLEARDKQTAWLHCLGTVAPAGLLRP